MEEDLSSYTDEELREMIISSRHYSGSDSKSKFWWEKSEKFVPEGGYFARGNFMSKVTDNNEPLTICSTIEGILRKKEWKVLKSRIDRFYKLASKEQIKRHNLESYVHMYVEPEKSTSESDTPKEKDSDKSVYLFKANKYYKIGISNNIEKRKTQLEKGMPYEIDIIHTIDIPTARHLEGRLHKKFEDKQVRGEWFNLGEDDLDFIKSLGTKNR